MISKIKYQSHNSANMPGISVGANQDCCERDLTESDLNWNVNLNSSNCNREIVRQKSLYMLTPFDIRKDSVLVEEVTDNEPGGRLIILDQVLNEIIHYISNNKSIFWWQYLQEHEH